MLFVLRRVFRMDDERLVKGFLYYSPLLVGDRTGLVGHRLRMGARLGQPRVSDKLHLLQALVPMVCTPRRGLSKAGRRAGRANPARTRFTIRFSRAKQPAPVWQNKSRLCSPCCLSRVASGTDRPIYDALADVHDIRAASSLL